ncbi:AMP-binding protein [Bacillus altitudinis]|uniref:AMP-binding protein n=1 Tax=Bacillus altitudinis TaxID=293387 RepID=UPI000FF8BAF9|nr:AMP-binding protein [Bacillus altitudinis]QAR54386.1 AMP-binding protein [Bacillus aerophilus]WBL50206.1 AMP-binding protein [Bacillus altitudinis]
MMSIHPQTIGSLLREKKEQHPAHEAIVYPERSLRYSYEAFYQEVKATGKGLMALGVQKGDHIAIMAPNIPEWLILQFACASIGAVLVTVNTNFQSQELAYLLKHSDSKMLFIVDGFKETSYVNMLEELIPELQTAHQEEITSTQFPYLKRCIYIGQHVPNGMLSWDRLQVAAKRTEDYQWEKRMNELTPDDVINMQYTSGTTGYPKGVMLSHTNIVCNASQIADCMKLTEQDRMCIPVPFFHCFGSVLGVLACLTKGGTIIPLESFHPERVLQTVEKEKCTVLHGVPTMFIAELDHPNFHSYDLSTLRTGIMAGSLCPSHVMKAVIEKMGLRELTIAYGQTESSPVITQTRTDDSFERRVQTVGRALPQIEVKIALPGTSEEVPRGQQGELCTRGYHVMKGYYKNEEATNEVIDEDGWLHTGDLAEMDHDGYVKITGRLKDMIIRGGENVYPKEIEDVLYTHPAILDAQVVGIPDETYGEETAAFIRLKQGKSVSIETLTSYCQSQMARYKIPKYFFITDEYPMTASGKIQKFRLKKQALDLIKE